MNGLLNNLQMNKAVNPEETNTLKMKMLGKNIL
jgi:hypothetical protein